MVEFQIKGALQSLISCISNHFWSITMVPNESLGSLGLEILPQ